MIAFVLRAARFLGLLLLVRIVLRALVSLARKPEGRPAAPGSVDLVRDPVCGTFVPRGHGVRALIAGEEKQFCSQECLKRALLAQAS